MSKYCQLLNSEYEDVDTYDIYNSFCNYFENPVMTKLKEKDNFSMYFARSKAMLGSAYRYLIVLIHKDNFPLGYEKPLRELSWVSLQTRTIEEKFNVRTYSYMPEVKEPLNQTIRMISQNEQVTVYSCEKMHKLEISLLHTRKNNVFQYPPEGNICAALETYQTVVSFR